MWIKSTHLYTRLLAWTSLEVLYQFFNIQKDPAIINFQSSKFMIAKTFHRSSIRHRRKKQKNLNHPKPVICKPPKKGGENMKKEGCASIEQRWQGQSHKLMPYKRAKYNSKEGGMTSAQKTMLWSQKGKNTKRGERNWTERGRWMLLLPSSKVPVFGFKYLEDGVRTKGDGVWHLPRVRSPHFVVEGEYTFCWIAKPPSFLTEEGEGEGNKRNRGWKRATRAMSGKIIGHLGVFDSQRFHISVFFSFFESVVFCQLSEWRAFPASSEGEAQKHCGSLLVVFVSFFYFGSLERLFSGALKVPHSSSEALIGGDNHPTTTTTTQRNRLYGFPMKRSWGVNFSFND